MDTGTEPVTTYRLTKHEGLGNDFLVLLDPEGGQKVTPELVEGACDRRRGIGADGLIRATRPDRDVASDGPDAVMELYNADGSRAEMSGNGIRCLAQALLQDGWATGSEMAIATDAGLRSISVVDGPDDAPSRGAEHQFSVEMGPVELEDAPEWALGVTFRAAWAKVGNPHLLLELSSPRSVSRMDLAEHGEKINAEVGGGANVHVLGPGPEPDSITTRTYERGVGLTEACGTGATVAAVAAQRWNLVKPSDGGAVRVNQPGGSATVIVGDPEAGNATVLIGPARYIAAVEFPWH